MLLFSTIIYLIYVTITKTVQDQTIMFKKHTFMMKKNRYKYFILFGLIWFFNLLKILLTHKVILITSCIKICVFDIECH